MTVSKLASKTMLAHSNNYTVGRNGYKVCKFTPHHMAAIWTGEHCAESFQNPYREASANYCIGYDGTIVCSVPEENRAWTSADYYNDSMAITVEVANDTGSPNWTVSDASWNALVDLAVDVCTRYGFRLDYTGTPSGTLTEHCMFASTLCPGPYLHPKMKELEREVNARLDGKGDVLYRVQLGAFKNKENARNMEAKVKAKGFSTYVPMVDGLYKIQVGAFRNKENADKLLAEMKKAGFTDAFITSNASDEVKPKPQQPKFKVGDWVGVRSGAKDYNGNPAGAVVRDKVWYTLDELNGDRAVLDIPGICTPFHTKDLFK